MPCYFPISAWRAKHENKETGKTPLVFTEEDGKPLSKLQVPCGQCIGCRLERSRQWAIRCIHEASLYEDNVFVTLTYDNENLPDDHSLKKKISRTL